MVDGDFEVILDAHAREQPAPLGHHADSTTHKGEGRIAADRFAIEAHHVPLDRDEPEDRLQQRRLAGAVGADKRDDLAQADLEIDRMKRLEIAIAGDEGMSGEKRPRAAGHASTPI